MPIIIQTNNENVSLPGRYAKCFYYFANSKNCLDSILDNFNEFNSLLENHSALKNLLCSKYSEKLLRHNLIVNLCEKYKWHKVFQTFLKCLSAHKRIILTNDIQNSMQILQNYEQNRRTIYVTGVEKKISEKTETFLGKTFPAKSYSFIVEKDESLLAGFYASCEGYRLDNTLKNKLTNLERQILGEI